MFKGLYAGTFDPPTLGHLNLIKRGASLCEHLVVGIGENLSKSHPILQIEERIEALKKETSSLSNVEIVRFSGLVTEFAKKIKATVLIRGIRPQDVDYEMQMAIANRKIGQIETFFLMTENDVAHISSTLIRELASHRASLEGIVPKQLETILYERLKT